MRALALVCLVAVAGSVTNALAQSSSDDLARELSNPIASLISVPFQCNFNYGAGPDGDGYLTSARRPRLGAVRR